MKNENLILARTRANKTQIQIANEVGVSSRMIQDYENTISYPSVITAIKIADAVGVKDIRELWAVKPL